MTPGATFSIGDDSVVLIGPLPSIGSPAVSVARELDHLAVLHVVQTVDAADAVR
jgi:hypothetical protein